MQLGGRSFVSIHDLHDLSGEERMECSLQSDEGCTLECVHEAFLLALRNSFSYAAAATSSAQSMHNEP